MEDPDDIDVEQQVKDSDSIYALAVTELVKTGWQTWSSRRLVAGLCFTVFLQMALVGLIWQMAATGNLSLKRSEADNIWVELGRIRRHVVQLQDNLTQMPPKQQLPPPCLETLCMYWPHFPGQSLHRSDYEMYDECLKYFCCLGEHPECLLRGDTETLNYTYVDKSVEVTKLVRMCYATYSELGNMTRKEYLQRGCNPDSCRYYYAIDHQLPELEYGWGLFHTTDSSPFLSHPPSCGVRSEGLENERAFVGHVNDWFHRNRYDHEPTPFVMVSYLVMLVVSFNEVRQSLNLLVYAAAKAGALPHFYKPALPQPGQQLQKVHIPEPHAGLTSASACFILVAPVLQLLVAFVLMSCSGGLLLVTDLQNSRASIIFNAVALAFVVDLDDRIGQVMRMQQLWMQKPGNDGNTAASTTAQCRPKAGYTVFALMGWLLLSHALLVAPQTPAQILAFLTTSWAYIEGGNATLGASVLKNWTSDESFRDGMTYNIFLDPRVRAIDYIDLNSSIWNRYAFLGFAGLTRVADKYGPQVPINRAGAIVMCSMYLLVAVFMVLLLCHSLLPCKTPRWCWALTWVQVVLVVVAQLQHLTAFKHEQETASNGHVHWVHYSRNNTWGEPMEAQRYGFVAVLTVLFASWLAMFVLWPIIDCWACHASDGEQAPETVSSQVVQVAHGHDGSSGPGLESKHGAAAAAPASEPTDVESQRDQFA